MSNDSATMKLTALLPWFGGKRTMAPEIVRQLGKHSYYCEGCAGSMAVLFAKEPSEHECVCDLHGGLTNLAKVVQHAELAAELFTRLQRTLYSDDLYAASKAWLDDHGDDPADATDNGDTLGAIDFAYHHFVASWMGRNGVAGTARVNYQIATRWTQGGGSGPLRFRNAVDSIPAWCERLKNVHILRRDMFDVLESVEDAAGVAIYVDPPYLPGTVAGNSKYRHDFANGDHERLALALRRFKAARVVVSYYADPQLQDLYPRWTAIDCSRHKHLHVQNKRGMGRKEAPEVLLINGPAVEQRISGVAPTMFEGA